MLLAKDRLPVFIYHLNDLLKVRGVAPCDLDRGGCLSDVGEYPRQQAIRLYLGHIVLDRLLLGVEAHLGHAPFLLGPSCILVIHIDALIVA